MKATLGDLYSPWFGTRALLLAGKNPYGAEVTHEIQLAFYGRDIVQQNEQRIRPVDEQRFAYPVYVVFLLAPVARVGFGPLHAAAPLVLALAVLVSVRLWMMVLRWRPPEWLFWAAAFFVLASPQIDQGLRLRQLGLIVSCLLALAFWLVLRNKLVLSGTVLALASVKPQMILLPLMWLLLWTIGDLRQRWRLPAAFTGTLVLLVGLGEVILPGWLRDFFGGLHAYRKYGPVRTLLQVVFGSTAGIVIAALLMAAVLSWGWMQRKHTADSEEFPLTLSAFVLVAAVALPLMTPFNQVLIILPLLMILRDWSRLPLVGRAAFVVCAAWPSVTSLVLFLWRVPLKSLRPVPLLPSALELFFPVLLILLLMTTRSSIPLLQNRSR